MKHNGIFKRIIFSPLVFLLIITSGIISAFTAWYLFIKFGGEWITYKNENDKKSIGDIFELLKEIKQENDSKICNL